MLDTRFKLPENQTPVFTDSKDPRNILQKYDQNFNPKLQDYLDPRVRQFDFLTSDFNQTVDFNILDLNLLLIGSPAGDTNQIQFNNGGAFAADENLQWRGYQNGGLFASGQITFFGQYNNSYKASKPPGGSHALIYIPQWSVFRAGSISASQLTDGNLNRLETYSIGSNTFDGTATFSVLIGGSNYTNSGSSVGIGNNNVVGNTGISIGKENDNNSVYGVCIGFRNKCYGSQSSISIGSQATSSGLNSISIGTGTASAQTSLSFGSGIASATNAMAFNGGTASGTYAIAQGGTATATGTNSLAIGSTVNAIGNFSTARGVRVDANSYLMTVFGAFAPLQTGWSATAFESHTPLFWLANGTTTTKRSVAFAVRKDANTSIGWIDGNAPNRLDVNAVNGYMRLAGDLNVVSHQNDAIPNLYIRASDGNIGINTPIPISKLDVNGNTRVVGDLNTGNNQGSAVFDSNGTLKLYGEATVFDDVYIPLLAVKLAGISDPDFTDFNGIGTYAYEFQDNVLASEDEVFFTIQMPHTYKLNSAFKPHLHWSPDSTNTGNARFQLNCSKADISGRFSQVTFRFDANSTTNKFGTHQISDSNITTSCTNISCIMQCKLWRNSSAAEDDYASGTYLHAIDFHVEIDTLGSDAEYVK